MRHLLLASILLLGVSWAAAQDTPAQTGQKDDATATSTGSQTTVQGCLSGSDGKYMLTSDDGKTFDLTGDTSKLAEHVGHEVKITGTQTTSGSTTSDSSGAMSNQSSGASLEVSSMKHVSKTCKNSGAMSH